MERNPCLVCLSRSGTWASSFSTGTALRNQTVGRQFRVTRRFQEAVATTLTLAGFQAINSDGRQESGPSPRWSVERSTCFAYHAAAKILVIGRVRRACRNRGLRSAASLNGNITGGWFPTGSRVSADARVVLWSRERSYRHNQAAERPCAF